MRHRKSGRHLNRTSSHRKAMLSNMSVSLIEHESIKTTVVKAKELRRFVEPLVTLSKTDSVANRRRAFSKLRSKSAVGKLFTELGPRYENRAGGYTRILKGGFRRGDASGIAYMQFVDAPLRVQQDDVDTSAYMAEEEEEAIVEEVETESAESGEIVEAVEAAEVESDSESAETEADASAETETPSEESTEEVADEVEATAADEPTAEASGEESQEDTAAEKDEGSKDKPQ